MADNWEDRLAQGGAGQGAGWEDRLKAHDFSSKPNPVSGSGVDNFLAGAGKAFSDLYRGVGQKSMQLQALLGNVPQSVPDSITADIAESRKLDAPLMATRQGFWGNLGGNVAAAIPTAFVPGANTITGSAVVGSVLGAMQPSLDAKETAANIGFGGVGGVAGNVAGRAIGAGYGLVKSAVQPFFASGRQAIVNEMMRRFVPNPAQAMQNIGADAGQIIPGSLPTAAEAAQVPGISTLTKQVMQTPGSSAAEMFAARQQANNAARVAAVRDVSGDPGQRAFFAADRDATANQLYGQARATGIDPAALTHEALQNIAQFQARVPASVLNQAKALAAINGTPMTNATSLDGMHWTKLALDGLISKEAGAGGNATLLRAYTGLKNDLVAGMDALSPDYAAARQTFAAMSRPINQMDVGQALSDKLIPALNDFGAHGNLRAAGFAEAMRNGDATAQRALGNPSATMADVLDPSHMATLNALGVDLARSQNANSLARTAGSDTIQNAISQNMLSNVAGPLGLPSSMAANTLLASLLRPAQWAGHLAEPQIMDQLATTLLSPQATRAALAAAAQRSLAQRTGAGLLNYTAPLGASMSGGLLSTPELAQ